jgi:hypothetical protein
MIMTQRENIGAQGEVMIFRLSGAMPAGLVALADSDRLGRPIIGHSESGHHHVLERAVEVMEQPNAPAGMRILYALLDEPTMLIQDASDAHGAHTLPAGLYEFRIAREYDPFMEQARLVAD